MASSTIHAWERARVQRVRLLMSCKRSLVSATNYVVYTVRSILPEIMTDRFPAPNILTICGWDVSGTLCHTYCDVTTKSLRISKDIRTCTLDKSACVDWMDTSTFAWHGRTSTTTPGDLQAIHGRSLHCAEDQKGILSNTTQSSVWSCRWVHDNLVSVLSFPYCILNFTTAFPFNAVIRH